MWMSALSTESQPWFNPYPHTEGLPFYLQSDTFARISNCFHTPFFTQSQDRASRTSRFTLRDGSARSAAQLRLSGDRAMVMRFRKICLTQAWGVDYGHIAHFSILPPGSDPVRSSWNGLERMR
jgi:hypothetical protein